MSSAAESKTASLGLELDSDGYVELLRKLIGETEKLQNAPPALVPREELAAKHVLERLSPFTQENGGPLEVKHIQYTEGRSNIIIKYPGTTDKTLGFVGSHLDVVPANPETWERNPFELTVEGDELHGRGTTDCLGHVALLTEFFVQLSTAKPELKRTVAAVFIASEEAAVVPGLGVDGLLDAGELAFLRNGPVIWVDCADSQPCIGTAGAVCWHLTASGRLFHSGLPHKGINALELAMDAVTAVQKRFYADFPAHPREEEYKFATPSTFKPTRAECLKNSLNQVPSGAKISGDIRITPFYDVAEVKAAVLRYVEELNEGITELEGARGPVSKYTLPDMDLRGSIKVEWSEMDMVGIATDLTSPGFKALLGSMKEVYGKAEPYSICGSLPLVAGLQKEGFDVQLTGFGLSSAYHADNEYCKLSDMVKAMRVLSGIVDRIESLE